MTAMFSTATLALAMRLDVPASQVDDLMRLLEAAYRDGAGIALPLAPEEGPEETPESDLARTINEAFTGGPVPLRPYDDYLMEPTSIAHQMDYSTLLAQLVIAGLAPRNPLSPTQCALGRELCRRTEEAGREVIKVTAPVVLRDVGIALVNAYPVEIVRAVIEENTDALLAEAK